MNISAYLKNVFKKKDKNADPRRSAELINDGRRKGESGNPYLAARRTWDGHVGGVVASRQTWQVIGILALLIAFASVGGTIYIGSQSKFIPYIVQVDKLGQAVASGELSPTTVADPRVMKSVAASFISDARMVTPDIAVQRSAILKVYSNLSPKDPATEKMNEWLTNNSPFARAEKEMVNVEINTVLQQSSASWQVEWKETTRDRQGVLVGEPKNMRALLTLYIAQNTSQTTESQIRYNPLGLYINDFSWSIVN